MPYYRWNFADDNEAETMFIDWLESGINIISFSFGKGIIVLFEDGSWGWTGVTKHLDNKLRGRQRSLPRPLYVATDTANRYFIQFADGECKWKASRSFSRAVNYSASTVASVAFAPRNGWYIVFKDGSSAWNHLPRKLHQLLKKRKKNSVAVRNISISHNGDWFVSYKNGTYDFQLPELCNEAFNTLIHECSPKIDHVWLGKHGAFCIVYDIPTKYSSLSAWDICFSQDSIESHFTTKQSVWKVISDLEKNILDCTTFNPIDVVRKQNQWISLNNRRLFVFQNAGINNIPVRVIEQIPRDIKPYRSVQVLPCKCESCGFGEFSTRYSEKQDKENDDTWARSWAWNLFLKEESPPSALLLTNSFILPSTRRFKSKLSTTKLKSKKSSNKREIDSRISLGNITNLYGQTSGQEKTSGQEVSYTSAFSDIKIV